MFMCMCPSYNLITIIAITPKYPKKIHKNTPNTQGRYVIKAEIGRGKIIEENYQGIKEEKRIAANIPQYKISKLPAFKNLIVEKSATIN